MNYARTHAKTLRKIQRRGAPIQFRSETSSVHDPSTETWTTEVIKSSIAGFAVELLGDSEEYMGLGLISEEPVTLLFVPVTYNEAPGLGWVGTWAGKRRTVRASNPIRPAGEVVAVRLVLT